MNEEHVKRAIEIIRLHNAWVTTYEEAQFEPVGKTGATRAHNHKEIKRLYNKLYAAVTNGEIKEFTLPLTKYHNGITWKDNEIGDVGRVIQGGTQYNLADEFEKTQAAHFADTLNDAARNLLRLPKQ